MEQELLDKPEWLNPEEWVDKARNADDAAVRRAVSAHVPGIREFAALISPAAGKHLEAMAARAKALTVRHFGKTISLYIPLYLSNYCSGGCAYCGFASDRKQVRRKLDEEGIVRELDALQDAGHEDVLLLTGEETKEADFDYLLRAVRLASERIHRVSVEAFAMTGRQYATLVDAGCTGITLYQETYEPELYDRLHRWGEKKDYLYRLAAPERALSAGIRVFGIGALLGLSDPLYDMMALYQHAAYLRKKYWRSGLTVSFPRICHEQGDYVPANAVSERYLAQSVFAFRILFPDMPLVLSTRESAPFRDGMAGLGISRMSVASKTSVGGYAEGSDNDSRQFDVTDDRGVDAFCSALRKMGFDPVFKNWDSVFVK
jgi:2-iminoacetate synthase